MRTVLGRSAGCVSLILATAGVVGSAILPAAPAAAGVVKHHTPAHKHHRAHVRIGTAVKYVRNPDGSVRRVR